MSWMSVASAVVQVIHAQSPCLVPCQFKVHTARVPLSRHSRLCFLPMLLQRSVMKALQWHADGCSK